MDISNDFNDQINLLNKINEYKNEVIKGNKKAIPLLGVLYHIKGDINEAKIYYNMVENDATIYYNLGIIYEEENNITKAEYYYKLSAELGDIDAQKSMGLINIDKNNDITLKYFNMIYDKLNDKNEKGIINCMLGKIYEKKGDNDNMLKHYKISIENDHEYAGFKLGLYYENNGIYDEAFKNYIKSAELGYIRSYNNLGLLFEMLRNDVISAEYCYKIAADNNNKNAQNNLGNLYLKLKKYNNAIYYLNLSINNGLIENYLEIGKCYFMLKNYTLAKENYKLLENYLINNTYINVNIKNKISSELYFNLGKLYYLQENSNPITSLKYFELSITYESKINNNNIDYKNELYYYLGILYNNSNNNNNNNNNDNNNNNILNYKSLKYFVISADEGNKESQYLTGLYYDKNNNKELAIKYYKLATLQLCVKSMYNLAILYEKINDLINAKKYFGSAITYGNIDAIYRLGLIHDKLKEYKLGLIQYEIAANLPYNYVPAIHKLGIIYKYFKKNNEKALEYFMKAYNLNNDLESCHYIGLIYEEKIDETKNIIEKNKIIDNCIKYYELSAKSISSSQNNLGIIYYKYFNNKEKSEYYFKLAIKNGNNDAKFNIQKLYNINNTNNKNNKN